MPCLPPDTAQVERRNWAKKRASTHTRIYKSHPGPNISHSDVGRIFLFEQFASFDAGLPKFVRRAIASRQKNDIWNCSCRRAANFRKIFPFGTA
jgi:hypothetical protein